MKYVIILVLLLKCITASAQTYHIDSLIPLYKMDSTELKQYFANRNIILKEEFLGDSTYDFTYHAGSTDFLELYRVNDVLSVQVYYSEELELQRQNILKELKSSGFKFYTRQHIGTKNLNHVQDIYLNGNVRIILSREKSVTNKGYISVSITEVEKD